MFIYTVKSPHALVSHVTVEGPYATFWLRKKQNVEFSGFTETIKDLAWCVSAEDDNHDHFHRDLSFLQSTPAHIHLFLRKGWLSSHVNQFLKLIERLRLASTPEGRQRIYNNVSAALERIHKRTNQPHPADIQKLFDEYDKEAPFIPLDEFDALIAEFLKYTKAYQSDPWYKRTLELVLAPISFCVARLLGLGLWGAGISGIIALAGVEVLARARDTYKYESYHGRSLIRDNTPESESFQIGQQAAGSVGKQFLSLFNRSALAHPKEYYRGMVMRQIENEQARSARLRQP